MSISKIMVKKNLSIRNLVIVGVISAVITLLFFSPGSMMINEKPIDSFDGVISVAIPMITFVGCIFSTFVSSSAIPGEYEKGRNQLVLIRGIKQPIYHFNILLGNIISSAIYYIILFIPIVVSSFRYSNNVNFYKIIILFLVSLINIVFVASVSTTVSNIGGFVLGAMAGMFFTVIGSMYNIIEFIGSITGGVLSKIIKIILKVVPNLAGSLKFGQDYIFGNKLNYDTIIYIGIALIIAVILLPMYKRKND